MSLPSMNALATPIVRAFLCRNSINPNTKHILRNKNICQKGKLCVCWRKHCNYIVSKN